MDAVSAPSSPRPGSPHLLHWRSLTDGLIVTFAISTPSLLIALILHGDGHRKWFAFLVPAAAGFALGGAIAGRHRRFPRGAIYQGAPIGLAVATLSVVTDLARHIAMGSHVRLHTVALWAGLEIESILVASVSALIGRWLYLRSRRRKAAGVR